MEGKAQHKVQPRALLVFGAPCSGKTTFAEQFSTQFKAPFFNLSELQKESGLTREHILLIVRQIAKTGQTLIIEGGLDTEAERAEIRNILREAGYNPALIWVQADATTIRNRLRAKLRSTAKAKAEYDAKIDVMEAPSETETPIVLSGKHTYATQLKHVLTQLAL